MGALDSGGRRVSPGGRALGGASFTMQQQTESNKETMPAVSLRNALAFIGCLVGSGLAATLIVGMAHDDMVGWFSHKKAHHHHAAKTQEMMVNPHTEEARLVLAQLAYEEQKAEEEAFNK